MGESELLSIMGLRKGYARGHEWVPVFADVSLEVLPGEIVAIVGRRLAGKTTLLKVAAGVERPDDGAVLFGGRPLAGLADRPREVRWVDRDGPGLGVGLAEFVGWPLTPRGRGRRQSESEAVQILDRVGARECLGRSWGELSNWQRLLVGLARGFVGSPQLIVVDDLLDALGEPATEKASDLVRSLVEASQPRCGVLMSVSDLESAMFADRVLTITSKGSLKLLSGRLTDAGEVVPFRGCAQGDGA
jgi:predicted ABC-type transport system involved in lysophospholipase L1 biosynthesis ATPase subunit